ncbi:hypothetical protein BLOT_009257 [Blomia tropicalis]|nr:hypothetical protein BLOT_009257 [Blomia tropicalis]
MLVNLTKLDELHIAQALEYKTDTAYTIDIMMVASMARRNNHNRQYTQRRYYHSLNSNLPGLNFE